jgi:peroxiredoxin
MTLIRRFTALALLATSPAWAAPTLGAPAPDVALMDAEGTTHRFSDFAGKTVVLEWTNHDCPFVKKHYGADNMQTLQRQAAEEEVVWLTVISSAPGEQGHIDAAKAAELTASRNAAPTAVIFDEAGTVGRAFDARTTPHMYVIDPEGTLVYAGGIDSIPSADPADIAKATPHFALAMAATVSGQEVPVASTRPYGCSVKYAN